MQFRRDATQEEVRLASQYRDDNRVIVDLFAKFPKSELWELNRSDIGRVRVTVPDPVRDTQGPLRDLFTNWLRWIEGPSREAQSDKDIHRGFVEALKNGRVIPILILQGAWEIHDERHRFFAMYDVSQSNPDLRARVYWVHDWPDGILAHLT